LIDELEGKTPVPAAEPPQLTKTKKNGDYRQGKLFETEQHPLFPD
jgi:hypothetical protein